MADRASRTLAEARRIRRLQLDAAALALAVSHQNSDQAEKAKQAVEVELEARHAGWSAEMAGHSLQLDAVRYWNERIELGTREKAEAAETLEARRRDQAGNAHLWSLAAAGEKAVDGLYMTAVKRDARRVEERRLSEVADRLPAIRRPI